jgi:glycosyltransferase involved in cell wall biosynthesis
MIGLSQKVLEICIAIPTLGKSPFLSRLLYNLENQVLGFNQNSNIKFRLIVIDNEPSPITRNMVLGFNLVSYIEEFDRGYSSARNRILEQAKGSDFVVMIDDDMRISDNWLEGVVHSIRSDEAHIYSSDVFAEDLSRIPLSLRVFFVRPVREVGLTRPNFGSGNVVLDLKFIESHSIQFNPRFNTHGGEDLDFFNQLTSIGASAKWVSNFPVYENHIASQLTFHAVAKREMRNAKNYERFVADNSLQHKCYLITRLLEVIFFDWVSFQYAISSSENLSSKTEIYFYHRLVTFLKILARLSVKFEKP